MTVGGVRGGSEGASDALLGVILAQHRVRWGCGMAPGVLIRVMQDYGVSRRDAQAAARHALDTGTARLGDGMTVESPR